MASKNWKKCERKNAALFGAKRNPLSGGASRHTRSDSLHPTLYLESKSVRKSSLWTLFEDTKAKAKREKKTPVILTRRKGNHGCLITIHSSDLEFVLKELALHKATYGLHGSEETD